jgi:Fe-S cluster assembly protein SufD
MLTLSFLAEAVEEIEAETLRDEINTRMAAWLGRRRG